MRFRPKQLLIFEINAWVWLNEPSRKAARPIGLASAPEVEWNRIAALGFDAVWLMGVWVRSPDGIRMEMGASGFALHHRGQPQRLAIQGTDQNPLAGSRGALLAADRYFQCGGVRALR